MTTPAIKIASLSGITRSAAGNYGIGVEQPSEKLTIAGVVQSTTGGFRFPDGTIQTTATTAQTYTLPTATASVLGGVKVGTGLTITNGVLAATATAYTLPTATTSVLGGVKVDGTTITITNGVISAVGGSGGGSGGTTYTLPTATTSVLGGVKIDGTTITITDGVIGASSTLTSRIGTLETSFTDLTNTVNTKASITDIASVVATETESLATRMTTLETTFENLTTSTGATVAYVDQAISDATGSIATSIATLTTNYNTLNGEVATKATISEVNTAISNATNSIASRVTTLETDFTTLSSGTGATVEYVNSAISNATGSIATDITTLQTNYNTLNGTVATKATMSEVNTAISNATGSIAESITTLEADYTNLTTSVSSKATMTEVNTAIANATGSIASSVDTLTTTTNGLTTTVSEHTSSINGIEGKYGVTIDNNGKVSGFQLLSGVGTPSSFIVNADNFKISGTGLNSDITPFEVDTVNQTINMKGNVNINGKLTATNIDAVNTINIVGNAVTIPTSAYTAGSINCPDGFPSVTTTIQSITFTSTGSTVLINLSALISVSYSNSQGNPPNGFSVEVFKGSTQLYSGTNSWPYDATSNNINMTFPFSSTIQDTPGAGSVTYTLKVNVPSQPSGTILTINAANRSLSCLEVKR